MPKPTSKIELIQASQGNYKALMDLVNSYTNEQLHEEFPPGTLNRNIRDVLAHLHHWHELMLNWYKQGMRGDKPAMPAKGFSWRTLPLLNKEVRLAYQNTDLNIIREKLDKSFHELQSIIDKHSNTELFQKKKYAWTGSTSLGVYLISNTSSHYHWAFKLIKKSKKY